MSKRRARLTESRFISSMAGVGDPDKGSFRELKILEADCNGSRSDRDTRKQE